MERPEIASVCGEVTFSRIRYSAAAMKSSKTFCFLPSMPAWCQASPYSAPPRRLATAYTPPRSMKGATCAANAGVMLMLKPPYP